METLTHTFTAPSGIEYTIREQNGQDEEILTNVGEATRFMNINNFLQAILMGSSKKPNQKYTMEEILRIPLLDRQCILLQSRIFSIGEIMEFSYKWPVPNSEALQKLEYEQDLNEFLLDYSNREGITEEELDAKPHALPFYPNPVDQALIFDLQSGKKIRFHLFDGNSELYVMRLPEVDRTRNTDIIARGLELQVEGKWDRVTNFSLFSTKDMRQLRKLVNDYDPTPSLETTIDNPITGEVILVPVMSFTDFFFPEEDA